MAKRRAGFRTAALASLCVAGTALVPPGALEAQSRPEGVWNIRSHDMTDRATGGVRVVLLRVQDESGDLHAYITSIRNTFAPVDEFTYRGRTMRVVFGSYEYTLQLDGDELTGTVVSPLGTQQVEGLRQDLTLLYVGDEPAEFRTTREGLLGHASGLVPPADELDPRGWMRGRIDSVEDLALIAGNRVKVPVLFTNARDFERQLLELAGTRVSLRGIWVGERLRIEAIDAATP